MASSWAMRPSSGGGFVPATRADNVRPRTGGCGGAAAKESAGGGSARCGMRRPLRETNAGVGVGGLMKPPSPPRDAPSYADIDALEQALNFSIRTAGLKPGRENQLADEAARLRRRRKGWVEETEKVLRAWIGHASLLWGLHEQELSKLNNGRREKERRHAKILALLTRQLEDERERGCAAAAQERDAAGAQLRAAQEGHELWKKAHHEETTKTAQREMTRITARLRRDAEQHARSVKQTLEVEYSERLAAALEKNEQSQARAETAENKVTRLESVARRLEAQLVEAAERTRRIERLSQTQKEVGEEVKLDLEKRAERLSRRLEVGTASIEDERSAHKSAVSAIKAQWREELRTVDERVRAVVGAKDQAIMQLTEDLETAIHRAETAEALLEELQVGICIAARSPSRDQTRHKVLLSSPPRRALSPG